MGRSSMSAAQTSTAGRKQVGTIDITPTWRQQAQTCIVLLESGNETAKTFARDEILRMAGIIDSQIEAKKERIRTAAKTEGA